MTGTLAPTPIDHPTSETVRVAEPRELFEDTDLEGFIDGALDDSPPVPISEGTVQIRRFESPLLQPIPSAPPRAASAATTIPAPPSWLLELADVVPARYEKAVVVSILFFFLFGVLSFASGVTILLFML